jgi:hypothetical protein
MKLATGFRLLVSGFSNLKREGRVGGRAGLALLIDI